jgi:hypothetical protein
MSTLDQASNFRHQLILLSVRGQGKTFAQVARRLGCTPAMVTMVSQGRRKSRRVQRALARLCARPVSDLFPEDVA